MCRFKSREEFAQRKEGFPYKQVPVLTIEGGLLFYTHPQPQLGFKKHRDTIVNFLPVFGFLGDSAWNCIPTVHSVVMGLSFSNLDFSAKGVVKGVCVWVAPKTTPEAEKAGSKFIIQKFIFYFLSS